MMITRVESARYVPATSSITAVSMSAEVAVASYQPARTPAYYVEISEAARDALAAETRVLSERPASFR